MISARRTDNRHCRSQYAGFIHEPISRHAHLRRLHDSHRRLFGDLGVEAPPGPMQCDPTEAASPRLMGLAFGLREGFKIQSTEFLSEVA